MDSSLISILVNGVSGGVVVVLIILGYLVPKPTVTRLAEDSARKDEVIAKQQETIALERQRGDLLAQAGGVTNQLIGGLVKLATEAREHPGGGKADRAVTPALDLTGKDIGL